MWRARHGFPASEKGMTLSTCGTRDSMGRLRLRVSALSTPVALPCARPVGARRLLPDHIERPLRERARFKDYTTRMTITGV